MDCNKGEAIRAKDVALKKMESGDFWGGMKLAVKAQKLYPCVEDIEQMILVCEVHCCAEKTGYGNERDWFKILKCEQTADDDLIKKQYRGMALMLHPDKNKFPGAADAFGLIREAKTVLLSQVSRRSHETKLHEDGGREEWESWISQEFPDSYCQPSTGSSFECGLNEVKRSSLFDEMTNTSKKRMESPNGRVVGDDAGGYCFDGDGAKVGPNVKRSKNGGSRVASAQKVGTRGKVRDNRASKSEQGLDKLETSKNRDKVNKKRMESANGRVVGDSVGGNGFHGDGAKIHWNAKRPKNKGSCIASAQKVNTRGKHGLNKVEKSMSFDEVRVLNEKSNGIDEVRVLNEKSKGSDEVRVLNEKKNNGKEKENFGGSGSKGGTSAKCYEFSANSGSGVAPTKTILEYACPEFSDFEKDRMKNCFKDGQVWASYDTLDTMPRFYALVNKVISEDFKIQITWLEPYSDIEKEHQWLCQGLPVSCGKFILGETETIQDHAAFSHLVNFQTGNFYEIYPRKGETWAVFKNWDISWDCDPKRLENLEVELVEILSDYDSALGIKVAFLNKIKGFTSLFKRVTWKETGLNLIPVQDMFRFSHKVPSIQMTGNERPDVPERCYELDPASLPPNYTGISASSSEPESFTVLDSEFHDFNAEKSPENIKIGQIWAVYSDEDCLPKYYGLVKKVNTSPKLTLHVIWLIPSQPHGSIGFLDKSMPVSCGKFKLDKYKKGHKISAAAISHQVKIEPNKNEYAIFPKKGEVWALYKPWNPKLSRSELPVCKYDVLEISEVNAKGVEAVVLEAVEGYKLVYRPQNEGQEMARRLIEWHELIKFSHQIPAFQLTGEQGGLLGGFWELDPAALPAYLSS